MVNDDTPEVPGCLTYNHMFPSRSVFVHLLNFLTILGRFPDFSGVLPAAFGSEWKASRSAFWCTDLHDAMAVGPAELLKASTVVTLILYLKYFISNLRWALAKGKAGQRAAEDFNNNPNGTQADVDRATHAGRIVQNDLENLPMGLVVIWASLITVNTSYMSLNSPEAVCVTHLVFTCMFCALRVLHTIIYELHIGLLRSIVFVLSMCSLFGLMILMVVAAFFMPETPEFSLIDIIR